MAAGGDAGHEVRVHRRDGGAGAARRRWSRPDVARPRPTLTEDQVLRRLCTATCARSAALPVTEDVRIVGSPRLDITP